ncbi:hypothetical protein BGW41_004120 [Actinomortierella wolfii]|nr:hypothetical protein BGW41_004120 [Actinomortierella wolfii]
MLLQTSIILRDLLLVSCLALSTHTLALLLELPCHPRLRYPFKDQFIPLARQDHPFRFVLLRDTFDLPTSCAESLASWQVKLIQPQPEWLQLDPSTWALTGTPTAADVGHQRVYLQVTPLFTTLPSQQLVHGSCSTLTSSSASKSTPATSLSIPTLQGDYSATFELDLLILSFDEFESYPELEYLMDGMALKQVSLPPSLLPLAMDQEQGLLYPTAKLTVHREQQRPLDTFHRTRGYSQANGPQMADSELPVDAVVLQGQETPFILRLDASTIMPHLSGEKNITYSARLDTSTTLPSWLHFNPTTLEFSGAPPRGTYNTAVVLTIVLSATTLPGYSQVTGSFQLQVAVHTITLVHYGPNLYMAPGQSSSQDDQMSTFLPDLYFDPTERTIYYEFDEDLFRIDGSIRPMRRGCQTAAMMEESTKDGGHVLAETRGPAITSISISTGSEEGIGEVSAPAWLQLDPVRWTLTGTVPQDAPFRTLVFVHVQDSLGTMATFKLQIFPYDSSQSGVEVAEKQKTGDESSSDAGVTARELERVAFRFTSSIPDQWIKINESMALDLDVSRYVQLLSDANIWPIQSMFAFEALVSGSTKPVQTDTTSDPINTMDNTEVALKKSPTSNFMDNIHACRPFQLWNDNGPIFPGWFSHTPLLYGPKFPSPFPATGTVATLSGTVPCSLTIRVRWTLRNAMAQWTATEFLLWVSKDELDSSVANPLQPRHTSGEEGDNSNSSKTITRNLSKRSDGSESDGGKGGAQPYVGVAVGIVAFLLICYLVMRYCKKARRERGQLEGEKKYIDLESAAAAAALTGSRLGDGRNTPMAASIRGSEGVPSRPISTYDAAGMSAAAMLLAGAGARGSYYGGGIASGAASINNHTDGGTPRPSRVGTRPEFEEGWRPEHHPLHPQLERLQHEPQQQSPQTPNTIMHIRMDSPTATSTSGLSSKFYKLYSKINATETESTHNANPSEAGIGAGVGTSAGAAGDGDGSPKRRGSMPILDHASPQGTGKTRTLLGWITSMRRERSRSLSGIEFKDPQVGDDPYRMRERQPNPLALKRISMGFPFDTLRPRAQQTVSDLATTDHGSSVGQQSGIKFSKGSRMQQMASVSDLTSYAAQSRQGTMLTVDHSISIQGSNVGSIAAGTQSTQASIIQDMDAGHGSPSDLQHHRLSQPQHLQYHHNHSPHYYQQSPRRHSVQHQSPHRYSHRHSSPHHSPVPQHHLFDRPHEDGFSVLGVAATIDDPDDAGNSASEASSIYHRFAQRKPTARQTRQARRELRRLSTKSENLEGLDDPSSPQSYFSRMNIRRHSTADHLSPNYVLRQSLRPLSSFGSAYASSGYMASVSGDNTSCAESEYDDSRRQSAYSGTSSSAQYRHSTSGNDGMSGRPFRDTHELDVDELVQKLQVKMQTVASITEIAERERRSSYLSVQSGTRDGVSRRQSFRMLDFAEHDNEHLSAVHSELSRSDSGAMSLMVNEDVLQANEAPLSPLSALSASLPSWNPFKADMEATRNTQSITESPVVAQGSDEPRDVIALERHIRRPQNTHKQDKGLRSYYSDAEISDYRAKHGSSNVESIYNDSMAMEAPSSNAEHQSPLCERAKLVDVPSHQPMHSHSEMMVMMPTATSAMDKDTFGAYEDGETMHPHDCSSPNGAVVRPREYVRRAHESSHGIIVLRHPDSPASLKYLNEIMGIPSSQQQEDSSRQLQQMYRRNSAHLPLSVTMAPFKQSNDEDLLYHHDDQQNSCHPHYLPPYSLSPPLSESANFVPRSGKHRHSVALHHYYPPKSLFSTLDDQEFTTKEEERNEEMVEEGGKVNEHEEYVQDFDVEGEQEKREPGLEEEYDHEQLHDANGTISSSSSSSDGFGGSVSNRLRRHRSLCHRRSESSMRTTSTQGTLLNPLSSTPSLLALPLQKRRHTVGLEMSFVASKDLDEDRWPTPDSAVPKSPTTVAMFSMGAVGSCPESLADTQEILPSEKEEGGEMGTEQGKAAEGRSDKEEEVQQGEGQYKGEESVTRVSSIQRRRDPSLWKLQTHSHQTRPSSYPALMNSSTSTLLDSPLTPSSAMIGSQSYNSGFDYSSSKTNASTAIGTPTTAGFPAEDAKAVTDPTPTAVATCTSDSVGADTVPATTTSTANNPSEENNDQINDRVEDNESNQANNNVDVDDDGGESTPLPTVRPRNNVPRPLSITTTVPTKRPNVVKATIGTAFHYTATFRYNGLFNGGSGNGNSLGSAGLTSRRTSSNGSIFGGGFGFGSFGNGPGSRASICVPTAALFSQFGRADGESELGAAGRRAPGSRMSMAGPPSSSSSCSSFASATAATAGAGTSYGYYFGGPRGRRGRGGQIVSTPSSIYYANDREASRRIAMAATGEVKAYLVSDPQDHYLEQLRLREQQSSSSEHPHRRSLESMPSNDGYQDMSARGLLSDSSSPLSSSDPTQSPSGDQESMASTTMMYPPPPGRKRKLPSWIQYNSKMQSLWGRPIPGTAGEWQVSLVHSLPSLPSSPSTPAGSGFLSSLGNLGGVGMSASLSLPGSVGSVQSGSSGSPTSDPSSTSESSPVLPSSMYLQHQQQNQQQQQQQQLSNEAPLSLSSPSSSTAATPSSCSRRRSQALELRRSLYMDIESVDSSTSASAVSVGGGTVAGPSSSSSCYTVEMDPVSPSPTSLCLRPRLSIDGDSMKDSESCQSSANSGHVEVEVERVLLIVREPSPKAAPVDPCLGSYDIVGGSKTNSTNGAAVDDRLTGFGSTGGRNTADSGTANAECVVQMDGYEAEEKDVEEKDESEETAEKEEEKQQEDKEGNCRSEPSAQKSNGIDEVSGTLTVTSTSISEDDIGNKLTNDKPASTFMSSTTSSSTPSFLASSAPSSPPCKAPSTTVTTTSSLTAAMAAAASNPTKRRFTASSAKEGGPTSSAAAKAKFLVPAIQTRPSMFGNSGGSQSATVVPATATTAVTASAHPTSAYAAAIATFTSSNTSGHAPGSTTNNSHNNNGNSLFAYSPMPITTTSMVVASAVSPLSTVAEKRAFFATKANASPAVSSISTISSATNGSATNSSGPHTIINMGATSGPATSSVSLHSQHSHHSHQSHQSSTSVSHGTNNHNNNHTNHSSPYYSSYGRKESLPSSPTYASSSQGWPQPLPLPMPPASTVLLKPTTITSSGEHSSSSQQHQHQHQHQRHHSSVASSSSSNHHSLIPVPTRPHANMGYSQPTSPIAIAAVHKGWVHHHRVSSANTPQTAHSLPPSAVSASSSRASSPPGGGASSLGAGSGFAALQQHYLNQQHQHHHSTTPSGAGGSYGSISSSTTTTTGRTIGQRVLAERMRIEAALLKNSQSLSTTPPGRNFMRRD